MGGIDFKSYLVQSIQNIIISTVSIEKIMTGIFV